MAGVEHVRTFSPDRTVRCLPGETPSQRRVRAEDLPKLFVECSCGWSDGPMANVPLNRADLAESWRAHVEQCEAREQTRTSESGYRRVWD